MRYCRLGDPREGCPLRPVICFECPVQIEDVFGLQVIAIRGDCNERKQHNAYYAPDERNVCEPGERIRTSQWIRKDGISFSARHAKYSTATRRVIEMEAYMSNCTRTKMINRSGGKTKVLILLASLERRGKNKAEVH